MQTSEIASRIRTVRNTLEQLIVQLRAHPEGISWEGDRQYARGIVTGCFQSGLFDEQEFDAWLQRLRCDSLAAAEEGVVAE